MKRLQLVLPVLASLLGIGCTVGPKYTRPSTPVTPAYKETPPDAFKETKDRKVADPGQPAATVKWWEMFGDPTFIISERLTLTL